MNRVTYLLAATLSAWVLMTQCAVPQERKRSYMFFDHFETECKIGDRSVQNGEIFTDPDQSECVQYQCDMGSVTVYSEGCEWQGTHCYPVGQEWDVNCITYVCTKTSIDGYNYFQSIVKHARCRDLYGVCHLPGERFPYFLYGQLHQNCSCAVTGHRISFKCF